MNAAKRNLTGYANNPPKFQWPNQARVAINFIVNYEEGGERCVLDGDDGSENYLTEVYGYERKLGQRSLFVESQFEYGSRAGIWRLLNLFNEYDIKFTSWVVGMAAEKNPQAIQAIYDAGHEIAGHGYRWIDCSQLDEQTEREHIQKTLAILNSVVKEGIKGWYNGSCSLNTRRLLVEAGIQYDSDAYNDDLPYWTEVGDKQHLVIPYAFDTNDAKYYLPAGWSTGNDLFEYLKASFDCLYREGEKSPKLMTIALHARISGHPGRAEAIRKFLDYLKLFTDIWICRRDEVAGFWAA